MDMLIEKDARWADVIVKTVGRKLIRLAQDRVGRHEGRLGTGQNQTVDDDETKNILVYVRLQTGMSR